MLTPSSSRQSLGHKKCGHRPGIGRLLRQGRAWKQGAIGIRHKGSGQGHAIQTHGLLNTGLLRALEDLRASLPESIPPSWASGDPFYSQKTHQAHQEHAQRQGSICCYNTGKREAGFPLYSQTPELCLGSGNTAAAPRWLAECEREQNNFYLFPRSSFFGDPGSI